MHNKQQKPQEMHKKYTHTDNLHKISIEKMFLKFNTLTLETKSPNVVGGR